MFFQFGNGFNGAAAFIGGNGQPAGRLQPLGSQDHVAQVRYPVAQVAGDFFWRQGKAHKRAGLGAGIAVIGGRRPDVNAPQPAEKRWEPGGNHGL